MTEPATTPIIALTGQEDSMDGITLTLTEVDRFRALSLLFDVYNPKDTADSYKQRDAKVWLEDGDWLWEDRRLGAPGSAAVKVSLKPSKEQAVWLVAAVDATIAKTAGATSIGLVNLHEALSDYLHELKRDGLKLEAAKE